MKQNVENRNQAVNTKNEKQNPATKSKKEPVKENATVPPKQPIRIFLLLPIQ